MYPDMVSLPIRTSERSLYRLMAEDTEMLWREVANTDNQPFKALRKYETTVAVECPSEESL